VPPSSSQPPSRALPAAALLSRHGTPASQARSGARYASPAGDGTDVVSAPPPQIPVAPTIVVSVEKRQRKERGPN
jgi:hypothetical protein